MSIHGFTLTRNAFGRLVLHAQDGTTHEGVVPVRAFPISSPEQGIALVDADGHELAWIAQSRERLGRRQGGKKWTRKAR